MLLLIVPIDDVVVAAVELAIDIKKRNNKSGVSILIEFLWWSAIIGLLLLLMKYSLAL